MRLRSALQLAYCVAGYYGVMFLLGAAASFINRDLERALERFWVEGLGLAFFPHVLFFASLHVRGSLLDCGMVLGVLAAIVVVVLTLEGWPRNALVIGLLLVAAGYGVWVAGPA